MRLFGVTALTQGCGERRVGWGLAVHRSYRFGSRLNTSRLRAGLEECEVG